MDDHEQARKLLGRALECQQAGDVDGAMHLYQASIAQHATAEAHTDLGWVLAMRGRYREAVAECKRAIEIDPTFGNPYNDIGAYLMELGCDDEAIGWLRKATEAPRYEARHYPHMNLARIHERRGQVVEALAQITRAAELAPSAGLLTWVRRLQTKVN
jgi:Tfp pilus assembly protein PilF